MSDTRCGILIAGNQLFPPGEMKLPSGAPVFMAEDRGLCTYLRHHQQKIVLILAAMREYADELRSRGFDVTYHRLEDSGDATFEEKLSRFVDVNGLGELRHHEIEGHAFAHRIAAFCRSKGIEQSVVETPMFLTPAARFAEFVDGGDHASMADFYRLQRRSLDILVTADGSPAGGRWSFDEDNRHKLPDGVELPEMPEPRWTAHTRDVVELVAARFGGHPGRAADFWWPVTRRSALYWLRDFLQQRLQHFGPYQDAITTRSETAFHSVLSPLLNIGLITPRDIIEYTLDFAREHEVPMNSLEGFLRQIIGWREFIRGIYRHFGARQHRSNFWGHRRRLTGSWYEGSTGIPPLDDAIRTANRLGWTHHINRLMVIGNLMNLSEIEPREVRDWFMEMHVDAYSWVMGPNVYGMALYSDGGIFATKPYACGSNYLLKMSDYDKGEWCDVVDGLYWRFIDTHRKFFSEQPRLAMMVGTLDRMSGERKQRIFNRAATFLEAHTLAPRQAVS